MALLTYGELESEVEALLGLQTSLSEVSAAGSRILLLLNAVESRVRQETGRAFVSTAYADEPIDSDGYPTIVLPDRPIISWTSIKQVLEYDDAGAVSSTYTIPRKDYLLYSDSGRAVMRSGSWPAGRQALLFSATLGYSDDDIADAATDDLKTLKIVLGSILAREHGRFKDTTHHMQSLSMGDGSSTTFRVELFPSEIQDLRSLRMRQI